MAREGRKGGSGTGTGRSVVGPTLFLLGYLGAWSAVGVFAFAGSIFTAGYLPLANGITGVAGVASGALVLLAGIYQLSPAKRKALQTCRSPMTFVMASWREGALGRVVMGVDYSMSCVSCCWAMMAVLVLVGAMSLLWMLFFAGVIFVERVLPNGVGFSKLFGAVLMISGAAIAGLGLL